MAVPPTGGKRARQEQEGITSRHHAAIHSPFSLLRHAETHKKLFINSAFIKADGAAYQYQTVLSTSDGVYVQQHFVISQSGRQLSSQVRTAKDICRHKPEHTASDRIGDDIVLTSFSHRLMWTTRLTLPGSAHMRHTDRPAPGGRYTKDPATPCPAFPLYSIPEPAIATMPRQKRALTKGDKWLNSQRRRLKQATTVNNQRRKLKQATTVNKSPASRRELPKSRIKNYDECGERLQQQKLGSVQKIVKAWKLEGADLDSACTNFKAFLGDLMPSQQPSGSNGIGVHDKPSKDFALRPETQFKNPLDLGKAFLLGLAVFAEETAHDKDSALSALRQARRTRWAGRGNPVRDAQELVLDDIGLAKVYFARLSSTGGNQ
ncbi:hypothetical protein IWX46DRAFT_579409 [Phyllosticta citricarpa]|uniref:Uncharacterized protein n=2 Tax=Phyllosticta TaxID=121621 RepID=A0ABR1MI21_9PEZI